MTTRRLVGGVLLAVLSGVLVVLSYAPYGAWPLVFVGLVPMVVAQYIVLPVRWSAVAPAVTAAVYWLGVFGRALLDTAPVAGVALPILIGAAVGVLFIADRPFTERTGFRYFVIQVPILWAGLDALRAGFFLTGTSGYLAYSLAPVAPWLAQPISVFGISALNLLILLVNYALAALVLLALRSHTPAEVHPFGHRKALAPVIVVGAVLVAWITTSLIIRDQVRSDLGAEVRVAVVQPGPLSGGAFGDHPSPTESPALLAQLAQQTEDAAADGAQLVVWPEEILTFNPFDTTAENATWLGDLVRSTGVYLVVGYEDPEDGGVVSNKAVVVDPDGDALGTYTKTHPVVLDNDDFPAGTRYPAFETPLADLGVIICYDYMFEDPARFVTLSGAQLIAVPAWDWGGLSELRPWELMQFRAIENRVAMAKAEHAWDSAIIDPTGEVLASTDDDSEIGHAALLVETVRLGPRDSSFLKLGDWVGVLLIAGAAVVIGAQTAGSRPFTWVVHRLRRRPGSGGSVEAGVEPQREV